jgi:hypothetical protein
MVQPRSEADLTAAHCWESEDRVPRDPAMTAFRRALRYHQARWREAHGHPMGTQPIEPRPGEARARPVGSRLPLAHARATGANFVTRGALDAARRRTAAHEPRQTLDHQRLWADLLSSAALAVNLFGDLAADHRLAGRAVGAWWPDAPGVVADVRFAHSPGRLDPAYTANLRAFDAAIILDVDGGSHGVVAVDTRYHERARPATPRPENLARYVEVAERSQVFRPGALDSLRERSDLAELWLGHLLVHSMLQHPSGEWTWGRYVVVHPAGNRSIADACARYGALLTDGSTFATATLEELLDARVLRRATIAALRERYRPG